MMLPIRTFFLVCSVISGASAFACPPDMEGSVKMAVTYQPGKNWSDFSKHVANHLKFLSDQMKNGKIQYAGPFLKGDDVDGGLAIYNLDDEKTVESLIQQDAVVKESVVTVQIKRWLQCSLKKTEESSEQE